MTNKKYSYKDSGMYRVIRIDMGGEVHVVGSKGFVRKVV